MSELVAGLTGVLVGGWIGLAVSKEELVFQRRVSLTTEFLRKAYKRAAEHLSPAVEQPDNIGVEKQELILLSQQVRLLFPEDVDRAIEEWIDLYHNGLTLVSDPGQPLDYHEHAQLFRDVNSRLETLRDNIKPHVSGSWLGNRWREIRR